MELTKSLLDDICKRVEEEIRLENPRKDEYTGWRYRFLESDRVGLRELLEAAIRDQWNKNENIANQVQDHGIIVAFLFDLAFSQFIEKTRSSFKNLEKLLEDFYEHRSIIFIGAGISFETGFGWNLIKTCLRLCTDYTDEQVDEKIKDGSIWQELRGMMKEEEFKRLLSDDVAQKKPRLPHRCLAEFIKYDKVEHLVCFNWDDFIERNQGFGVVTGNGAKESESDIVWKPCGCVTRPDLPWAFPDEEVVDLLNQNFVDEIQKAARIGIIAGFSGTSGFNKRYIQNILGNVNTYDIRPAIEPGNPLGEFFIGLGATYVFKQMFNKISPRR